MDMTLTLLWFLAGAVSCQIIRKIVHFHEERQVFVNIVTAYIPFIKDLKTQIIIATSLKEKSLRDAGIPNHEIEEAIEGDKQVLEQWEILASAILLSSVPKKFHKYLKY